MTRSGRLGAVVATSVMIAGCVTATSRTADAAAVTTHRYQFGPAGTTPASGYLLDSGAAYTASRGHGWQTQGGTPVDLTWATRSRGAGSSLERNLVTASRDDNAMVWRLNIADGTYSVSVGVGDPSYIDSVDNVTANGKAVVSRFVPTTSHHNSSGTATVSVTDGRLLVSTAGGTRTKLNYVTVSGAAAAATSPAHLAWMYNSPSSSSLGTVVDNFDTFVVGSSQTDLVDRVRAAKKTSGLYQYFLLNQIIKPPAGKPEYHNNAAYQPGDFASLWKNHPDWFMRDSKGNALVDNGTYYRMDPGNSGWRSFWLARVKAASTNWNGVFADNVDVSMCGIDKQGHDVPEYQSDSSYTDAFAGFLKYVWTNYFSVSGKKLMLNLTNSCTGRNMSYKYAAYNNYDFNEGWGVDWHTGYLGVDSWDSQLSAVESATASGHGSVLVSQGSRTDYSRQQFAFASYLLVVAPDVSFRYSQYGNDGYDQAWLYSDYSAKVGSPTRQRYKLSDGVSWRRDFTNGSVTVNPSTHSSKITVNS